MRIAAKLYATLTFATLAVGIGAQQSGEVRLVSPPTPPIHFTQQWRPDGSGETLVVGTVVDIDKAPVAKAHVRLRDITSGKVIAETDADSVGNFEFKGVEPGSYVVEMVLTDEHVIALSNAAALARYQTFVATVQLAGRWDYTSRSVVNPVNAAQFFGLPSTRSMTASTLSMAANSEVTPVDPGEPVSPQ